VLLERARFFVNDSGPYPKGQEMQALTELNQH